MNVVLGVSNGKKVLRDARVNKPWEETASKLDEVAALDKRAVIIGDADREMRKTLVKSERNFSSICYQYSHSITLFNQYILSVKYMYPFS